MKAQPNLVVSHEEMTDWRRTIHRCPEIAFQEHRTAAFVAEKLESFGLDVHHGLGGTGVVGTLCAGLNSRARAIGLRADMDALPVQELNTFAHRSGNDGCMHACGHDGHSAMLLGAAAHLAATHDFDGTVHFIFQPAEETGTGAREMIREGLFDRFPMDAVYGMHTFPGIDAGTFAMRKGPLMAGTDFFELAIRGVGGHAAFPHTTRDPIVTAAQVILGLQAICSRQIDPVQAAVVSVTRIRGGESDNVIPEEVVLGGTARSFAPEVQEHIESAMQRIAESTCSAMGLTCSLNYERRNSATVNSGPETDLAAAAAARVVGAANVRTDTPPVMGGEDFAWMLREKPGCYVLIGNGTRAQGRRPLHHPEFDFNDAILPTGAAYWVELVRSILAPARTSPAARSREGGMPAQAE